MAQIDVYMNEIFVGQCSNGKSFVDNFKKSRRSGEISTDLNIRFDSSVESIYIEGSPGRVRRPVVAVVKGKVLLTNDVVEKIKTNELGYDDLVSQGIIEYIDALEEEDCLIAMYTTELTEEHTHVELSPILMFGLNTGTVPFSNYDEPGRLMRGQKTIKQAVGTYTLNFLNRKETDRNVLINPQKPLVGTFTYDLLGCEKHPAGQNLTVAIMSFEGYNMEDGIILNEASIQRGMQRSFYYKNHTSSEVKYPGGLQDRIGVPNSEIKGYRMEEDYRYIEDDGIVYLGQHVAAGDVIIGKIAPPRFIEEIEGFGQMVNLNIDASLALREGEAGVVSSIFLFENNSGDKETNILLRSQRSPIVGDKFASRHGQKGVIGGVIAGVDMPVTNNGTTPDLIFSPHSIPGRKTVSHVMEVLAGKVAALSGEFVDANPFDGQSEDELREQLKEYGLSSSGTEIMFDPKTGKRMEVEMYIGSLYYLRLSHQVANKIQARGTGPVQLLTRQPAEGRMRGGGLKLGEMEKDALLSHGSALLLKERFSSDQTTALICSECGYLGDPYLFNYKSKCPICNTTTFNEVEIAYAFKLLMNELKSLGVNPTFGTNDRFFD